MDDRAAETICLSHLKIDFLPFHDVFRSLYGNDQLIPNLHQFDEAINLFQNLVKGYNLKVLLSLKKEITVDEAVAILRNSYINGKYETVNYSIWISNE